MQLISSITAGYNRVGGNTINVVVYLTDPNSTVYYPELVKRGSIRLKNGNYVLKTITFNKYFGNSTGVFNFSISNQAFDKNTVIEAFLELDDGTTYSGTTRVLRTKETVLSLVENSKDVDVGTDYRTDLRLKEFGSSPVTPLPASRGKKYLIKINEVPLFTLSSLYYHVGNLYSYSLEDRVIGTTDRMDLHTYVKGEDDFVTVVDTLYHSLSTSLSDSIAVPDLHSRTATFSRGSSDLVGSVTDHVDVVCTYSPVVHNVVKCVESSTIALTYDPITKFAGDRLSTIIINEILETRDRCIRSSTINFEFSDTVVCADAVVKRVYYPPLHLQSVAVAEYGNHNNILITAYLLDYLTNIYHPELVKSGTVQIKRGRTTLKSLLFDKYFGNADGTFNFSLSNSSSTRNISFELEITLEDEGGTRRYRGPVRDSKRDTIPLSISTTPIYNDFRSLKRLAEFGESPVAHVNPVNLDFDVKIYKKHGWFCKYVLADSIRVTDYCERAQESHRIENDVISCVDSISVEVDYHKVINDSVSVIDRIDIEVNYNKTVNDSVACVDKIEENAWYSRELNDAIVAIDRVTVVNYRNIYDTIAVIDLVTREVWYVREQNDHITTSDSTHEGEVYHKVINDSVVVAEDYVTKTTYAEVDETIEIDDETSRVFNALRVVNDSAATADSVVTVTYRDIYDTVVIVDAVEEEAQWLRVQNDSISCTDSVEAEEKYHKILEDSITCYEGEVYKEVFVVSKDVILPSDSIIVAHGSSRVINDSLIIVDEYLYKEIYIVFNELVEVDDNAEKEHDALVVLNDSIVTTDLIARAHNSYRELSDSTVLFGTVAIDTKQLKVLNDTIYIPDLLMREVWYRREEIDTPFCVDYTGVEKSYVLNDSISTTDELKIETEHALNDSITIVEGVVSKFTYITRDDLLMPSDQVLKEYVAEKIINDFIIINDTNTHVKIVEIYDSIAVTDYLTHTKLYEINDSVLVTDSLSHEKKYVLSDSLTVTDSCAREVWYLKITNDSVVATDHVEEEERYNKVINDSISITEGGVYKEVVVSAKDVLLLSSDNIEIEANSLKILNDSLIIVDEYLYKEIYIIFNELIEADDLLDREDEWYKEINDSITITDNVIKSDSYEKTINDSLTIIEDSVKKITYAEVDETVEINDEVSRAFNALRIINDSIAVSDSYQHEKTYVLSDSIFTSDSILKEVWYHRVEEDSVSVTEDTNEEESYLRNVEDFIAITDQLVINGNSGKVINDSVTVTDLVKKTVMLSFSDVAHIDSSEIVYEETTFYEVIVDNDISCVDLVHVEKEHELGDFITCTDSCAREVWYLKTTNDSIVVTDSVGGEKGYVINDSIVVTEDSIYKLISTQFDSIITPADLIEVEYVSEKILNDSIVTTDYLTRTKLYETNDSVTITDSCIREVWYLKTTNDSVATSDSSQHEKGYVINDSIVVTEGAVYKEVVVSAKDVMLLAADDLDIDTEYLKIINDSIAIVDSYSHIKHYIVNELVSLTDSIDVEVWYHREKEDYVAATDSVINSDSYEKVINDSVTVTDLVKKTVMLSFSDVAHIDSSEIVYEETTFYEVIVDNDISCVDLVQVTKAYALSDSIACTDSVYHIFEEARTLTDSISCTDSASRIFDGIRTLTDSISCTDASYNEKVYTIEDSITCYEGSISTLIYIDVDETIEVLDSLGGEKEYVLTDSVTITEDSVHKSVSTQFDDILVLADSIVISHSGVKTINDSVTVVDEDLYKEIYSVFNELVEVNDEVSHIATTLKTINDSIACTDSVAETEMYERSIEDSVSISETLCIEVETSISESISMSDLVMIEVRYEKVINDSITCTDSSRHEKAYIINDSIICTEDSAHKEITVSSKDVLLAAESVEVEAEYLKTIDDSIIIVDSYSHVKHYIINESISLAESVEVEVWYQKVENNSITVTESVINSDSYEKVINDSVIVVDEDLYKEIYSVFNDLAEVDDELNNAVSWVKEIEDSTSCTDAVSYLQGFKFTDSCSLTDNINHEVIIAINDVAHIDSSEIVYEEATFYEVIVDNEIACVDSSQHEKAYVLSDSISCTDSCAREVWYQRVEDDSIACADFVPRIFNGARTLTDSISCTDISYNEKSYAIEDSIICSEEDVSATIYIEIDETVEIAESISNEKRYVLSDSISIASGPGTIITTNSYDTTVTDVIYAPDSVSYIKT